MFWRKPDPEKHRYYCLPGMGRSNRRYRRLTNLWAVIVGVVLSLIFAAVLYFTNRP